MPFFKHKQITPASFIMKRDGGNIPVLIWEIYVIFVFCVLFGNNVFSTEHFSEAQKNRLVALHAKDLLVISPFFTIKKG